MRHVLSIYGTVIRHVLPMYGTIMRYVLPIYGTVIRHVLPIYGTIMRQSNFLGNLCNFCFYCKLAEASDAVRVDKTFPFPSRLQCYIQITVWLKSMPY